MNRQRFWDYTIGTVLVLPPEYWHILTDGHFMDLNCGGIDRSRLRISRNIEAQAVYALLSTRADIPLAGFGFTEGRTTLCFRPSLAAYKWPMPDGRHVLLQKRYSEYFRRAYPSCEFWASDPNHPVAIRHKGQVVGFIMPLVSYAQFTPADLKN